jgi:Family of unknown function (DUF6152)
MRTRIIALVIMLAPGSMLAHHNTAAVYDAERPLPLEGIVTAVQWRNPHTYVFVDAKTNDGTVVNWKIELLAGLVLSHEGIAKDVLKAGDPVRMTVCVAKDGSHAAAAKYFFVPSSLENRRAGVCKGGQ